jgi:CNT family concentrative nucleoside transporter
MDGGRFVSVLGLLAMVGACFLLSENRRAINWRSVGWGIALQLIFASLILKTTPGLWFFDKVSIVVTKLISFQTDGAKFLFGSLGSAPGEQGSMGFFFAFQVLPTIVFFSALMSILYYLGIMQRIVLFFARIMAHTCQTSGAESLSASANIFVGQTEAPLLIRPFVEKMTRSELMCVMTGGMATVAGGVMAAYVMMLTKFYPDIAGHLLAASVMSAPAALVCAKMIVPECEKPVTMGRVEVSYEDPSVNVLDAAASGTTVGLQLALNVGAMLVAFMSLLAMANWGVKKMCGLAGHPGVGFEQILGWLCAPLAWLLGTPWADCEVVGRLIGEKTTLNEFVAYTDLARHAADPSVRHISHRAYVIATYALCGFSNFLSIGIQIGGIGALAPSRRSDLARLGIKALIAGSFACFMTAAIAGMLID